MMFHADYYEPRALAYRGAERGHMARKCDECEDHQVCPDAQPLDDTYRACRFGGCEGGTLVGARYLCGMCY